jgi:hypothetical protein
MSQNILPVRLATTGPISIAHAPAIIDGVAACAGDRILVKNQIDPIENGIYIWHAGGAPMTRAPDSPRNPAGNFFEPKFPELDGKPRPRS